MAILIDSYTTECVVFGLNSYVVFKRVVKPIGTQSVVQGDGHVNF